MAEAVDVMIDTETGGTAPGSAVLSIGAVEFRQPQPGWGVETGLGATFYRVTRPGVDLDYETVRWWFRQSHEAQAVFRDEPTPVAEALADLRAFLLGVASGDASRLRLWCHGATFDVPLLEAAYRRVGVEPPWGYRVARDTRTVFDLTGERVVTPELGVKHNALADATAQALAVIRARAKIAAWWDHPPRRVVPVRGDGGGAT